MAAIANLTVRGGKISRQGILNLQAKARALFLDAFARNPAFRPNTLPHYEEVVNSHVEAALDRANRETKKIETNIREMGLEVTD